MRLWLHWITRVRRSLTAVMVLVDKAKKASVTGTHVSLTSKLLFSV